MYLDIYVLTGKRNESTILKFIDQYVNQQKLSEEIIEYDLLVLPEGRTSFNNVEKEELIHCSVSSKQALIELGLEKDTTCFWVYLPPLNKEKHDSIILQFTSDGYVVLGITVWAYKDYEGGTSNMDFAIQLRDQLYEEYEGIMKTIQSFQPPPNNRQEMQELMKLDIKE